MASTSVSPQNHFPGTRRAWEFFCCEKVGTLFAVIFLTRAQIARCSDCENMMLEASHEKDLYAN